MTGIIAIVEVLLLIAGCKNKFLLKHTGLLIVLMGVIGIIGLIYSD